MNAIFERNKPTLRVLIVHERFPPDYKGGGEYFVLEQARILKNLGLKVTVLTCGDPAMTEFEGIETIRLPISSYRLNFATKQVKTLAKHYDVIHCFTYHSVLPCVRAGRQLNKPVVIGVLAYFGDVWREMRGPVVGRVWQSIERYIISQKAAAKVYISDFSKSAALKSGFNMDSSYVLEPGILLEDYFANKTSGFVMFSGKFEDRKGLPEILKAAERLPHIPFKLIGWGADVNEIQSSAPSNVKIEAFRDRKHLAENLSRAKIFLFPSRAETFGLAVAEAMASSCAVVSTVDLPFEGVRLKGTDVDEIVDAVDYLWQREVECQQFGEINRKRSSRYCWSHHGKNLVKLYEQICTHEMVALDKLA